MGIVALGQTVLDALIFGYKTAQQSGTPVPIRTIMNFVGATLTDDPTNQATIVNIPGVMGSGLPFTVDGGSAAIAAGQWFCASRGGATVTLATATTLTDSPVVLGVAMTNANPGQTVYGNVELMVPNAISGLGAGVASRVRLNTSTSRAERVTSFSTSDYPLGGCNPIGDLTLVRGIVMNLAPSGAAGGDLGGTYPNPSVAKINGSSVPAGGSLTAGNVPFVSGAAALSYGAFASANVAWPRVKKTANYTINLATDLQIDVDTSGGAFALQWPAHQDKAVIFIKDVGGALATAALTLKRVAAENIENVAADRVFTAPGGSWRIEDDGTNLWVS